MLNRTAFSKLLKGGNKMKYGKSKMVKPKVKKVKPMKRGMTRAIYGAFYTVLYTAQSESRAAGVL